MGEIRESEPLKFLELVDAVEVASNGNDLQGAGRRKCLAAFRTCPRDFAILVERALQEGRRNPCGLLVRMVDRRQHEKAERAAAWNAENGAAEIPFGDG